MFDRGGSGGGEYNATYATLIHSDNSMYWERERESRKKRNCENTHDITPVWLVMEAVFELLLFFSLVYVHVWKRK